MSDRYFNLWNNMQMHAIGEHPNSYVVCVYT